jgi:predicted RNA methylase
MKVTDLTDEEVSEMWKEQKILMDKATKKYDKKRQLEMMNPNKTAIIHEIASAFSLSDEAAQTACLLLEARARTLDYTFDEYMQRYHPEGFAEKDETLDGQWQGYVQFLGDDAAAILRAGKSANFSTFVHECAHVFRRQLTGELREQADKAFGIEGGIWNVEKEELFSKGLELWIKRKHGRDKTRADVYNKGKNFVDTVYRGMERIVEIDSRMEEVYERLFEDSKYIFKQTEYEKTLAQIVEGKLPKDSHIFIGMTPRIYEELGFQRLPMAITTLHLYSTLRSSGALPNFNYHDLGEDILSQFPKQLKNPLLIVQSPNDEAEIISVIGLTDKKGDTIIVPVAQYQKGNINGAEIDINLVKSTYGKKGFENWLKEAIDDKRLLYIDKKKTEPIWMGQGFRQVYQHFPDRSILPPELKPPDVLQNISGFLTENIAHYREAVKKKFPERFAPAGERILYKIDETHTSQLSLEFTRPPETGAIVKNESPEKEPPVLIIPQPNTPENFKQNFISIAGEFKTDTIEAARFLLRSMSKDDRTAALAEMQNAGCSDRESYHKYLFNILSAASDDSSLISKLETLRPELEAAEEARQKGISGPMSEAVIQESVNLRTVLKNIDQQRKERNSQLSSSTKEFLTHLEKIEDIKKLESYLDSAKKELDTVKGAYLKTIKDQYDYEKSVEISGTVLHSTDIPDRVSPADIKEMLIYNAQYIFDATKNRINDLKFEKGLFNTETNNEKQFQPYGAWTDFNSRLSVQERERYNNETIAVLEKAGENASDNDKAVLRRYSGFGGISAAGERGVLYDYYTSPPVARLVWQLLDKSEKIKYGAKVLEPSCGTGVFFEYAPKDKALFFTGVELDNRTSQVARLLHAKENIEIINQSFEAFNLSGKAGGFDRVIGNAPFGERSASTASLDLPEEKSLDNYFVSRSIDNLKEGGTMALIAAPGVLENITNEEFRLSLNKKAQFIGAVKLPNRSFHHSHTQVMPDILLFRKYPDDIQKRIAALDDEAFKTTPLYDNDFVGGTYFENHPGHIAGTLSKGTGQWGNDEVKGDITPESLDQILSAFTPADSNLENVFEHIRGKYQLPDSPKKSAGLNLSDEELQQIESKSLRHGAVKVSENKVYVLTENYSWLLVSENEKLANKITDVKAISNLVHTIQGRMKKEIDVSIIQDHQKTCCKWLLEYLRKYNTFPSEDTDLKRFTRENPAVQGIYEAFLTPDDPLLTQENVYRKKVDILDGHNTAVTALLMLSERMKEATEENIRIFFPDTADSLIAEMRKHNDVFITPQGSYQLREDFIAGDAWMKIDELREAAQTEETEWKKELLLRGAAELEKAVGWTPIEDADFSPRSSWIPQEIVREWASSKEALGNEDLGRLAKNDEGKWGITYYGGPWQEYADPLIYYLNGQKQRSRLLDTDAFNKEHDELFRSFIANHEGYRAQLESDFNRKFKTHIVAPVKTYPVEIAGWRNAENGGKTLKPHQWQSVHHLYRQQCGISALGTGFGKTATAISLMSLLRQEGKAKRIFLQVPNNKVKDWIEEIHSVMPSLKIASIDPEEPGYSNREKRYAKYQAMARSDADIIIMPESAGSEIQLSPENDERVTGNVSMLYRMEKSDRTARQQERAAQKGEYKAQSGKTNVTVCFEDFGCDVLIVDEAHRYKNLFSSSLSRETGLNDGRQSDKAMSLYKKSEYIREQNNGKNVFLLTATPLTNSPLEYYNMMQYIAPEDLRRMGVATIDGFIHEFAKIETGWLYDWGSGQVKNGRILTGFKNLSTLQNLFFTYTDLQNNPEAIGLEKPSAENRPHIISADEKQTDTIKSISLELDRYKSLDKDERKDEYPGQNFLTFYTQMRTASLDLELYDPDTYKNWKNPKLTALAHNAYNDYKEKKGGQVIFCDRVFSSDAGFNIHEKIKKELVAQGFKEREIVIVNGFTKSGGAKSDSAVEKEVSKAIADYNAGKYKVIIGSTACIGEGVNLQKNSSAVHHFDIPFRPSDFIQRNGRVDRQGNEQDKVSLNTYLAAGTIDNYSVNLVQRKANWIDQLLRTKSEVFTNPNDENSIDADELLLALTEEWGDKDAALKRREELEKQKQEKIKEAQTTQMKGQLKNLSLARGALQSLGENTAGYKKRAGQISNIETALKANPVFARHDILGKNEPFLYNSNINTIFRIGDVFINRSGTYLVEGFNYKKQELNCKELLTDEEKRERAERARINKQYANDKRTYKLSELSVEGDKYSYSAVLRHYEKTSKETREIIRNAGTEKFYALPNEVKENFYNLHLIVINERYGGNFNPYIFFKDQDGKLNIENARYHDTDKGKPLNPFSNEGKAAIIQALEKGVKYDAPSSIIKNTMIETISKTFPDLKDLIGQAIEKVETKEKQAKLEEELIKQAAIKMNADKAHLKNHIHVVR